MGERAPRYSWLLWTVVTAGGAGLGLIAVGTTVGDDWVLQIPGFVLVIVALPLIYVIQQRDLRRQASVASPAAHDPARRPPAR